MLTAAVAVWPLALNAQIAVSHVTVNIPYAFSVGSKTLSAGTYEIRPNFTGTDIEVRYMKGTTITLVSVITRLNSRELDAAELVFDVVEQNHYVSEFLRPGMDGLAFNGAPGKHKHQVIVSVK